MQKELNIKKIFIYCLIIGIVIMFVQYNKSSFVNNSPDKNYSEPIVKVYMAEGPDIAQSLFVLYPDNIIHMFYGDSMFYGSPYNIVKNEPDIKYDYNFTKIIRKEDRKRIDKIVESIKGKCLTYDELSFEHVMGSHKINCKIDDKIYCAEYLPVKNFYNLSNNDANYQIVELVYEFYKYFKFDCVF